MKKKRLLFALILLITIGVLSACALSKASGDTQLEAQNLAMETLQVELRDISLDMTSEDFTYYDLTLQQTIQEQIDEYKQEQPTLTNPLLIINPYGTNTTGLYVYFEDDEEAKLQVSIDAPGYETYRNLYEDTCVSEHEHQIIGMVAGVENTITLSLLNEQNETTKEVCFTIQAPELASGFVNEIEKSEGSSTEALSDGLYVALGLNFTYDGYTFLIDNDGVVRGELVLDGDMNETMEFYQGELLLNTDETHMALIDPLGKVSAVYDLQSYIVHHDYKINEAGQAIILATDTRKESVEDIVLKLDLNTGDFEVLLDFDEIMSDYKAMTTYFSDDSVWGSYGDHSWDWLHFNTLQLVNDDELILSSRETSTIMKLSNLYEQATIDYFIADESIWEGTAYEQYLLNKIGDFPDTAGQHTVTYLQDEQLEEGQYYLYMFNNNFWCYESRPSYTETMEDASGNFYDATATSYYTCYLVDETEGTYSLVERMEVPYSSIVSSTQWVGDTLIVNSGVAKTFQVYDEHQNLIASYCYDNDDLFQGYRILKYGFHGYWFA